MLDYLVEKITDASFSKEPFRHLYVENFFKTEDFDQIINDPQVNLREANDEADLLEILHRAGYEQIEFPGSTTSLKEYLDRHKKKIPHNDTCEGIGVTLRLKSYERSFLETVHQLMGSEKFLSAIRRKFDLLDSDNYSDGGLQKYLDGYEISPHPDVRRKALTYMVNINPSPDSESLEIHTHYLRLKEEHAHVGEYWRKNQHHDRCWLPWSWCETVKVQRANNSLMMFAPGDDTLHAVRANYNHLVTQRTQLYGNLWYYEKPVSAKPSWWSFAKP